VSLLDWKMLDEVHQSDPMNPLEDFWDPENIYAHLFRALEKPDNVNILEFTLNSQRL
jgi:hypothetical protein